MVYSVPVIGKLDVVGNAVGAATWLVGVVLEKLIGDRMTAWAERNGLGDDVQKLQSQLRRVSLVLGAARGGRGRGGHKTENEQLAMLLAAVRRLVYDARNLLDELDYFILQEKIEDACKSRDSRIALARSVFQFARGIANKTSSLVSSATRIFDENPTVHQENPSSERKRRARRGDIMDGIKRMKLDVDDKMALDGNTESGKIADGISDAKLDRDGMSRQIKNITRQLEEMYNSMYKALKLEKLEEIARATSSTDAAQRFQTTSYGTECKVREPETNRIIELMAGARSSNQHLLILPITGDGGIGKTTLARQVYNQVPTSDFDIKIWIDVTVNFDEARITREILECVSDDGMYENATNLNMLQQGVQKNLSGRFLLVLDNMWEDKEISRWDKLLAPLRRAPAKGNVILVTTRKLSVAKLVASSEHVNLDGLKGDVFWRFFKGCVFGDENYQGQKKLQRIGEQIAMKLKGNPLAAKSIGTLLKRNLNEGYWRRIIESEEWKLQEGAENILPVLMLSYNHLPSHLQRCFSYCALFPKDYKFDKEELVRLWIAQDFVHSKDERTRAEDIGSDYLDDLVDWSFFQKFEDGHGHAYYLMHDLIHDLALSLGECLTVDDVSEPRTISPSVRHVSIITGSAYREQENGNVTRNERFENKLDKIQNEGALRSLSTLMLFGPYDKNFSEKFVKVFAQLRCVRVLRLSAVPFDVNDLLSNISKFIHLRYLELRSTATGGPLPDALCKLYHLQVLDIRFWRDLVDLPTDLSNLVNLRHLLVPEPGTLHSRIARVGELIFLQELKEFRVRKEIGFEIGQLGELNDLRGSLSIRNLENVTTKEEASEARLRDKKHLRKLWLSWERASSGPDDVQTAVMEGLEPNERLEHLRISKYAGAAPSWLGRNFSLDDLESLRVEDCTAWQVLPPIQKLTLLERLCLIGLSALKEIQFDVDISNSDVTASLTELEISHCPCLASVNLRSCTELQKLSVKDCENLASLDGLHSLTQLTSLEVRHCPLLTANSGFETQCRNMESIQQLEI